MQPYKNVKFEHLGYAVDYHVNGKYVGSINIQEKDREVVGWAGKKHGIAEENIKFSNRKVIKVGTPYYTFLYPLCGKSNINLNIND